MKRIAYGYKRVEADFSHLEYDHIFFDTEKARPVLAETIRDFFYRGHGDILLLVASDDLPDRGPFKEALKAKGVTIEVHDIPDKRGRGRPPGFAPTPKQDAVCLKIWNTPYYREHAAKKVSEVVGYPVTRWQLGTRYGEPDFTTHT